jgi:penicillin-binding protein 1C
MKSSPERRIVLILIAVLAVETALVALDTIFPPDLGRAHRSSPVALDRRGAWLRALPVEDGRWRIRADLERTDPSFLRRVVMTEDAGFYQHPGVNPLAVARAAFSALTRGHVTSGASTLSMQTARLLEPHPRTLLGKLVEMIRAVQIEARYSKHDILALYLTLAPYGGNLEGVRAASLSYFGHEPESLTIGEQALLIALPQAPEGRRPDRRPEAARQARDIVLARMAKAGLITPKEAAEAETERMPIRQAFPSMAWHIAGQLARKAPDRQASVVSTIDASLQARLEPLAASYAKSQGAEATASILVVQIEGRAVRAAVGSGGLDRPGGWIDMTTALRSPGSSLKPFIYAFAFDDGVAAPDTRIQDVATRFSDYQPENFDRTFHGQVTAREALSHSLNVPAVAMMERIGPASFLARLESADVRLVTPKKGLTDPGLAIALGGEGITLRDLALLYAALGDGGIAKPLAWTEEDAARRRRSPGRRLVRAASAKMVLDILRDAPGPKGRMPAALTRGGPSLAFKTGTSYGFRDAVAAGVVGDYVIICWTGRADGGARGGLTGRDAALPMLFDVADMLAGPPSAAPSVKPRNAPLALQKLERADDGPRMIFPPDKATVQVDEFGPKSRGLSLAATGKDLSWYAEGQPLDRDPVSGQVIWRPAAPGFYRLKVIDGEGREAVARVRVK